MNSIMHPLHHGARSIPAEVRPDCITALERNAQRLSWDRQDLEFLFTVYNRYVAPKGEPEDVNCAGCRTKVIGKMRQYANLWEKGEI
jgi:hypothetical protein